MDEQPIPTRLPVKDDVELDDFDDFWDDDDVWHEEWFSEEEEALDALEDIDEE